MKILLIDHHALLREGLRCVLQQSLGGVEEILEADSFPGGLKLAAQHPGLDLALLELRSPGCEGLISIRLFHERYPLIPLVVVSSEEDDRIINGVLEYGARAFVSKKSAAPVLSAALKQALYSSIHAPAQLLRRSGRTAWHGNNRIGGRRSNSNEYGLTVRQMDILKYMATGLSDKEIARAANLAEGTVKAHVAAVRQALSVKNRIQAIRLAKRLGLIDGSCGYVEDCRTWSGATAFAAD